MRYAIGGVVLVCSMALAVDEPGQKTDWRALTQKPHAQLPLADLGLKPLLETKDGKTISTRDAWAKRRQDWHDAWSERLGKAPPKPAQLEVKIHQKDQLEGYTRQLVSFHSADGDRLEAYLLIPDGIKEGEKRPAVVVFHPTTQDMHKDSVGLGKNADYAMGVHLVKRGYVVLCPQCYILKDGWAKAQAEVIAKKWPGWTGLGKMTFDASRCIDFLESLPFVAAGRIGCIGHSLGAKEVLFALAFEPRYQAGVFSEGGIGLRMSNWTDAWYLTDKMKKYIPELENHQVLALCAPRPILILGGDSADGDSSWTFVKAALPVYELLNAGERIGFVNHHKKHTFGPEAQKISYRWLDEWLTLPGK